MSAAGTVVCVEELPDLDLYDALALETAAAALDHLLDSDLVMSAETRQRLRRDANSLRRRSYAALIREAQASLDADPGGT